MSNNEIGQDSIAAIQKCLSTLGFDAWARKKYQIDANFNNIFKSKNFGPIKVTIQGGSNPSVEFGDTIKSYGVIFTFFSPLYQRFDFNEASRILTIKGDDYEFDLEFN